MRYEKIKRLYIIHMKKYSIFMYVLTTEEISHHLLYYLDINAKIKEPLK